MPSSHDLDALLDEIDGEGDTVTLFGEEWTLPTDVDADTMLRVQRLQMKAAIAKRAGKEMRPEDVVDDQVDIGTLVEKMAGPENYAEWRSRGLGYRQLTVVAGKLYAIHSGEAGQSGKARPGGQGKSKQKRTGSGR